MKILMGLVLLLTFVSGCEAGTDTENNEQTSIKKTLPERTVVIESSEALFNLFEEKNYTPEAWQSGIRDVPRLLITSIPERWKDNSPALPVTDKKQIFFRIMAPLVLRSNELILSEREHLLGLNTAEQESRRWLAQAADKYGLGTDELGSETDFEAMRTELKSRIDIIPVSLVLAQAAEESGWGTSRFSIKGNALFGQWDFSGKGMKPKQQRKELGNYGIAQFDTPLDSVEAYMLNLNSHSAYQKLRDKRAELRKQNQPVRGLVLTETLDKYSERGMDYVDSLKTMINYNKLADADLAALSGDEIVYVTPE